MVVWLATSAGCKTSKVQRVWVLTAGLEKSRLDPVDEIRAGEEK